MRSMIGMVGLFFLFLIARILVSIWIYRDAKLRNDSAALWLLASLFISTSIVFLVYIFAGRKESNIICSNCGFTQPKNLKYCGSCGQEIIKNGYEDNYEEDNNTILKLGIILLVLGIIIGLVFTARTLWRDIDEIPLSVMSTSLQSDQKWTEEFKFKIGSASNKF